MDSLQQKQQALVFEHSCWEGKWGCRNKFTITKAQQQWQRQKTHNHHLQQKLTLIEGWVLVLPYMLIHLQKQKERLDEIKASYIARDVWNAFIVA
jgi:hypothetical protein